ncbi:TraM recognition domain-containing protein, partial [Haladaptatus sp.]|uniref:TraM recognition domain-containing protein n=1 Tax=Haladaptatus sp. TaxID=1973141 RepID=UPI003C4E233E
MITLGVMRPIWSAVQNRSFEDGENEPFFAIFDEFDAIASQNLDVKNMLARARSMRLSVTIACQYPEQLKEAGVLSAVKANCNNPVIFRLPNDEDARPVAKLFKGYNEEDLMETENYQVWTRIPIKGGMQYSDPLKIHTFAPYPPLRSEGDAEDVIHRSLSTSQSILGQLFLKPEFCVGAVALTVSTREAWTNRRRAVAVGGGLPPTRQRRHSYRRLARPKVTG